MMQQNFANRERNLMIVDHFLANKVVGMKKICIIATTFKEVPNILPIDVTNESQ